MTRPTDLSALSRHRLEAEVLRLRAALADARSSLEFLSYAATGEVWHVEKGRSAWIDVRDYAAFRARAVREALGEET